MVSKGQKTRQVPKSGTYRPTRKIRTCSLSLSVFKTKREEINLLIRATILSPFFTAKYQYLMGRGSSGGIATGYGLGGPGIESR